MENLKRKVLWKVFCQTVTFFKEIKNCQTVKLLTSFAFFLKQLNCYITGSKQLRFLIEKLSLHDS